MVGREEIILRMGKLGITESVKDTHFGYKSLIISRK